MVFIVCYCCATKPPPPNCTAYESYGIDADNCCYTTKLAVLNLRKHWTNAWTTILQSQILPFYVGNRRPDWGKWAFGTDRSTDRQHGDCNTHASQNRALSAFVVHIERPKHRWCPAGTALVGSAVQGRIPVGSAVGGGSFSCTGNILNTVLTCQDPDVLWPMSDQVPVIRLIHKHDLKYSSSLFWVLTQDKRLVANKVESGFSVLQLRQTCAHLRVFSCEVFCHYEVINPHPVWSGTMKILLFTVLIQVPWPGVGCFQMSP